MIKALIKQEKVTSRKSPVNGFGKAFQANFSLS